MILSDHTYFQGHVTLYSGYRVDNSMKKDCKMRICSHRHQVMKLALEIELLTYYL
jgi:hypothetical protein